MENNQLQKRPLPKLEDLYGDIELPSKFNDFNKLLNAAPKAEWVKVNSNANDTKYLPIERVEYLLTALYTKWRLKVKSVMLIANSVVVTVRLFVLDPITGEWDWQDGVGASPIQTNKGASAADFTQVKSAAVQMAAPAAESYAFKDAAEKFGKIFGKDLNRKDEINYQPMQDSKFAGNVKLEIPQELRDVIEFTDETAKLTEIYNANKEFHANPEFMRILNKRKQEIKSEQTKKTESNGSFVDAQ